jgi:membrane AbrB-like protein
VIWSAATVAACAAGEAAEPVFPAPHLLIPLLAGLAAAGSGLVAEQVPRRVNRTCQAVLGVLMGSYLSPVALHQAAGALLPLAAVTAATILFSLATAAVLTRTGRMDRATATLGMVPGGSAAVVSCAEGLDADPRLVAFMQYVRVGLVAMTAPMLVHWLFSAHAPTPRPLAGAPGPWHLVTGAHQGTGLLLLAVVALAGAWLGRRIQLPSPALLGPMLVTGALTLSMAAGGFAPTGVLRSALFTIVGLDVGLRFNRSAVARMGRLLPLIIACTLAISAACTALAWLLSSLIHIPLPDAYLATTPGGINAVLAIAVATHADVSLISSVQSLRLFAMMLLAPFLIRLTAPRPPKPHRKDEKKDVKNGRGTNS